MLITSVRCPRVGPCRLIQVAATVVFIVVSSPYAARPASKRARTKAPDDVIADLYRVAYGDESPFFPKQMTRAYTDQFFAKRLADLIWQNLVYGSKHPDLVAPLEEYPLYNESDPDGVNFSIGRPRYRNRIAYVVASYQNYWCSCRRRGWYLKTERVLFTLVRHGGEWKIANIRYSDGRTLITDLKEAFKEYKM